MAYRTGKRKVGIGLRIQKYGLPTKVRFSLREQKSEKRKSTKKGQVERLVARA